MKTVNVKIEQKAEGGRTHSVYPPECGARWIVVETDSFEENGKSFQWRLGLMPDERANYLSSTYPEFYQIVTDEQANEIGKRYFPKTEKITDDKKILSILAKKSRGESITKEEEDAIDPEKDVPGIQYTKEFDIEKIKQDNIDAVK